MVVETVGDEDAAVRQKCHVLRLAEVRAVLALHVLLPQRLEQLAAVIREDVDRAERLVDDPHAVLGVVRADAQPVRSRAGRALAQRIPLGPPLLDVAVRVEGVEAVLPHAAGRGAEHVHADRSGKARKRRRYRVGQPIFSALCDEDPVGRFREDAGISAEREPRLGERLVPGADDVVRARADRSRDHSRRGLCQQRGDARDQRQDGCRSGGGSSARGDHHFPLYCGGRPSASARRPSMKSSVR